MAVDDYSAILSLVRCFEEIEDPRINRRRVHNLIDIIVIAICAVIFNADGWADMRTWAEAHRQWLQKILQLPGGLPSRDTLRRTLSRLDPQAFQQAFLKWLKGLRKQLGNVIAIDGKALRGSKVGGVKPLHIVSAWASDQHLTLGQTTIDTKSNEITAIPKLLESLTLSGAIVTIDAMGCQRDIAAKIIQRKGHYCLAVKGNVDGGFRLSQFGGFVRGGWQVSIADFLRFQIILVGRLGRLWRWAGRFQKSPHRGVRAPAVRLDLQGVNAPLGPTSESSLASRLPS